MSSSAARTSRTARYAAAASARNLAALTRPTRASLNPGATSRPDEGARRDRQAYDPMHERDNCGVGLVADLNKKPSRVILTDCNEMLVSMSHRGGVRLRSAVRRRRGHARGHARRLHAEAFGL